MFCILYQGSKIKYIIISFVLTSGIVVVINFITILLFPEGMYEVKLNEYTQNWLLGYKNAHIYTYLPFLLCLMLLSVYKKGKITAICIFLTIVASIASLMVDSMTSTVAMFIFLLLTVFFTKIFCKYTLRPFYFYISTVILSYLLLVQYFIKEGWFHDIINIFSTRSETFSGRTVIWFKAIKYFINHAISGNGIVEYVLFHKNFTTSQAHNAILDTLVSVGIAGFIFYSFMLFLVCRKLVKERSSLYSSIFAVVLIAYFVTFLMEMYSERHLLFFVLLLGYDIKTIKNSMPIPSKTIPVHLLSHAIRVKNANNDRIGARRYAGSVASH
jgi:O-antigen ligase